MIEKVHAYRTTSGKCFEKEADARRQESAELYQELLVNVKSWSEKPFKPEEEERAAKALNDRIAWLEVWLVKARALKG